MFYQPLSLNTAVLSTPQTAVDKGHAPSMKELSTLYLKGQGVPQNTERGVQLMLTASKADYPPAQFNMAVMFLHGVHTDPNPYFAFHWFLRAAGHSLPVAEYNVARCYAQGIGTEQVRARDSAGAILIMIICGWPSALPGLAVAALGANHMPEKDSQACLPTLHPPRM